MQIGFVFRRKADILTEQQIRVQRLSAVRTMPPWMGILAVVHCFALREQAWWLML